MKETAAERMQDSGRFTYDDVALEKMQRNFSSYDDLLRYVKRYGMHRHFE
jgi:hypothetical protein